MVEGALIPTIWSWLTVELTVEPRRLEWSQLEKQAYKSCSPPAECKFLKALSQQVFNKPMCLVDLISEGRDKWKRNYL